MFLRSETSNVSPKIDFQRDLERDKQLPAPEWIEFKFLVGSVAHIGNIVIVSQLTMFLEKQHTRGEKSLIAIVCIFGGERTSTNNETFDPGFKSPSDAWLGLQMAPW